MRLVVALLLSMVSILSYADEAAPYGRIKAGVNMLNLLVLGDINGTLEKQYSQHMSLVGSLHMLTGSSVLEEIFNQTGFRFSGGVRAYSGDKLDQNFVEFKLGLTSLSDNGNTLNGDNGSLNTFSAEFYVGGAYEFNDTIYYEGKAGIARSLSYNEILPAFSVTLGMYFD